MLENPNLSFFSISAACDFFGMMAEDGDLLDTVIFCSEHDFTRPLYFKISPEGAAAIALALRIGGRVLAEHQAAQEKRETGAANDG